MDGGNTGQKAQQASPRFGARFTIRTEDSQGQRLLFHIRNSVVE